MRKEMIIAGEKINIIVFKTRQAADKYINKKGGKIVYFRAHEYCVAVS